MLIFILAVVALTRKIPHNPPEDGLEAVNPSIPDGNNSTGRSELLSVIATDGVVGRRPLQRRSASTQSSSSLLAANTWFIQLSKPFFPFPDSFWFDFGVFFLSAQ